MEAVSDSEEAGQAETFRLGTVVSYRIAQALKRFIVAVQCPSSGPAGRLNLQDSNFRIDVGIRRDVQEIIRGLPVMLAGPSQFVPEKTKIMQLVTSSARREEGLRCCNDGALEIGLSQV